MSLIYTVTITTARFVYVLLRNVRILVKEGSVVLVTLNFMRRGKKERKKKNVLF